METLTAKPSLTDASLLGSLISAADSLMDRSEQGNRIARHILSSATGMVVFHGKAGSGKTDLIRHWVLPSLPEEYRVFCSDKFETQLTLLEKGDRKIDFWNASALHSIIVLDRFEDFFAQDPAFQVTFLKQLAKRVADGQLRARLAFVIRREYLSRLFVMRDSLPQIVDEVYEIESISGDKAVNTLCQMAGQRGLRLDEGVSKRILADFQKLETSEAGVSAEMLAVVVFRLCQLTAPDQKKVLTLEDYEIAGELGGLLRGYVDSALDGLPDDAKQLAAAILEDIVIASRAGKGPDFADLASRFDASVQNVGETVRYLEQDRNLLRRMGSEQFEVIPLQLIQVIDENISRREKSCQQAKTLLRQSIRIFLEQAVIPPEQNFKNIHLQRSSLKTSEEEAKLMLRSSVVHEDGRYAGATRHWLRRVRENAAKVDILLSALFDPRPAVRERAACFLADFNQPEVRSELHLLALRDPSVTVRDQAVESLAKVKDEQLRESLVQEVRDPSSRYRGAAISALRIFPDKETTSLLVEVISSPNEQSLRTTSIQTLAQLRTPEALSALLQVALGDNDAEDRLAAATALGSTRGGVLIENVLERLRNQKDCAAEARRSLPRESFLIRTRNAFLAFLTIVADLCVHGLILCILGRVPAGISIMALGAVGTVVSIYGAIHNAPTLFWSGSLLFLATGLLGELAATSILLREGKRRMGGSYRAYLNLGLFVLNALPFVGSFFWVHGLAHMVTKRFVRGATLFGFELMGLLLFSVSFLPWVDVFPKLRDFYIVVGSLLFLVSYAYDVFKVLADSVLFLRRRECRQRVEGIYQEILRNPEVCVAVLQRLDGEREEARWAARTLKTFAAMLDPTPLINFLDHGTRAARNVVARCLQKSTASLVVTRLTAHWKGADLATKKRIAAILSRQASEQSLGALRELAPELGWSGRAKYVWALWAFRFSVWPKSLLVFMILGLCVLSGLAFAGYKSRNELANTILRKTETVENRVRAGRALALVNPETAFEILKGVMMTEAQDLQLRGGMAVDLGEIAKTSSGRAWDAQYLLVERLRDQHEDAGFRKTVLNTLRDVAISSRFSETSAALVPVIFQVLSDPQEDLALRRAALEGVQDLGTASACAMLQEFVESPQSHRQEALTRAGKVRPSMNPLEQQLRMEAINALGRIAAAPRAEASLRDPAKALETLEGLASESKLGPSMQRAALTAIEGSDATVRVEFDFHEQKYENAIKDSQKIIASNSDQAHVARAHELMGLAYYHLALKQPDNAAFWQKSIRHLETASESKALDKEGNLVVGEDFYQQKEYEKARTYLHRAIELSPQEGSAFALLLYTYMDTNQIDEALADFRVLQEKYTDSIYPGLNLAFVYHENLAPKDPQFYTKAYEVYPSLLAKKLSGPDLVFVRENFIETNLTTGRYQDTRTIGEELLKEPSVAEDTLTQLNLRFLVLASVVFQGEEAEYRRQLKELLLVYHSLRDGTENTWRYSGTRSYINLSKLPPERKQLLISLADLVESKKSKPKLREFCHQLAVHDQASFAELETVCRD